MKSIFRFLVSCWMISLVITLAGCSSVPPPPPVSELRAQAQLDLQTGHTAFARRNWASADAAFARAAERFGAMDDYGSQAVALVNRGHAVLRTGAEREAETIFLEAGTMANRIGANLTAAAALAGQAQCASSDSARAEALLEQALKLAAQDPSTTATLQNDLAVVLMRLNKPNVMDVLQSALATNEKLGRKRDLAVNRLNLGRYHLDRNQPDIARLQLDAALSLFRVLDDPEGLAQTHESLARLHTAKGDPAQSEFHRQQALEKYRYLQDTAGIARLTAVAAQP